MENFQEFEQPIGPEKTAGSILSHSFEMYKGVFLYAIIAMVIIFFASFLIQALSGFDSRSLSREILSGDEGLTAGNMLSVPGLGLYYGLSGLLGIVLSPLYVGIIYMTNKYNLKEPMEFSDLFIAYKQNTLNIMIYSLITGIIMAISFSLCVLPGFFVVPLLLLGYPILIFENVTFSEALGKSFNIAKENYATFLGASVLGILISIAGVFLCGIGLIASMPFYLVVMYSTYCAFCGRPRPLVSTI